MKVAIAIAAGVFAAMYVGAQATLQHPKDDGTVHLRWATDANPARNVQTAKFDEMYRGVDAAVDPSAGGDASKVIVQCATGVGPDLIDTSQDTMETMVSAGILLDLTPYAKQMGFDASKTYPAISGALGVQGKQYRFPCNVDAPAIIYNKKIFDDHGIPYPKPNWTYDEFVKTSKLLLATPSKSGEKHLAVASGGGGGFYMNELVGRGGRFFSEDGLHSALNSPESIAAMQDYYNWIYVDKIIPSPADSASMSSQGGWGSGAINWFSCGKAAMIMIGRWYICQLPNYPDLEGNLGAVEIPKVGDRPSCALLATRAAGINVKSKHKAEALKFLQYLASPQYGKIVVDDGDALPPDPTVAQNGKQLVCSLVPDPAFHAPFVAAAKTGKTMDYSPYIDASTTSRWIGVYTEKVENKLLTPKDALMQLAAQINETIRLNLERRPDLQKLYTQRTGKPYSPTWWRAS